MNIFEYFEASGRYHYVDFKRESVWFLQLDGSVVERPWDGSYTRTLNRTWYWPEPPAPCYPYVYFDGLWAKIVNLAA